VATSWSTSMPLRTVTVAMTFSPCCEDGSFAGHDEASASVYSQCWTDMSVGNNFVSQIVQSTRRSRVHDVTR
jgi:hypothetical protein